MPLTFLYLLLKQAVLIAVPVELAVPAAEKRAAAIALGVKANQLKSVARDVGNEGNVVGLCHLVGDLNIKLVFDIFDLGGVGVVGGFGLKRWQGDAAAADGGCAVVCRILPQTGQT